jgi:uncharacterized protein (DUF2252 family)
LTGTELLAEGNATTLALEAANRGRRSEWLRIKYERMSADVFAFFRGSNPLFASAWAELGPRSPGPAILVCGDLHLENFGAFRAEDGSFCFDLNDFDEALVAPASVDLVRCATSVLLAAQVWGLSPIQGIRTVLGYLDHYRSTLAEASGVLHAAPLSLLEDSGPIRELLGQTAIGTQPELLEHLTKLDRDGVRTIRRDPARLPSLSKRRAKSVAEAVEAHGERLRQEAVYRVLDVTGRIAGIGSLGVRRYVALVAGDGTEAGARLFDIKEAVPSSFATVFPADQPPSWSDSARRVVEAQRALQALPTAGLDVIEVEGRGFRIRELIPEENRATLDRYRRKPGKLRKAVEVAGRITALAQLRGARFVGVEQVAELARWADGPAIDAALAASVRLADRARADFKAFRKAPPDPEA